MNSSEGTATPEATLSPVPAATADIILARALLLGERLDTRALERNPSLGAASLTLDIPDGGIAVLFRYGAVVLIGLPTAAMDEFVATLAPSIAGAFLVPEREEARLLIRAESDQHVDASGNIILRDKSTERLQLVADILAKSLVLSHYETRIADLFDRIEPLAAALREKGRAGASGKVLLRHIGDVLLMQQQMVGRVEIAETPELLWEYLELERFYMYKYGLDLTGGSLVVVGVAQAESVSRQAALMFFSVAIGRVSKKVCIGVLP